jgi:Uncharacterized protein conserved in bacteria, prophage-related
LIVGSDRVDEGLKRALVAIGGYGALARALGITKGAVWQWRQVPPRHVITIERLTGIPREVLRPDLHPSRE